VDYILIALRAIQQIVPQAETVLLPDFPMTNVTGAKHFKPVLVPHIVPPDSYAGSRGVGGIQHVRLPIIAACFVPFCRCATNVISYQTVKLFSVFHGIAYSMIIM
jgi:hypothetical protein